MIRKYILPTQDCHMHLLKQKRSNNIGNATHIIILLSIFTPEKIAQANLEPGEVQKLLKTIDERQKAPGDYRAVAIIDQHRGDSEHSIFQSQIYRRDVDERFLILFTKPRTEAGKGYLRIDQNLFMYDPTVGRWERRTERERIMGTDTRRSDLDEWNLSHQYHGKFVGYENLGKFKVQRLKLSAQKGKVVPYPQVEIWVDMNSLNVLKRQDFALSGRLLRTSYYPVWKEVKTADGKTVAYPAEMRIFDEVEKGHRSTVIIAALDLQDLDPNIFTKAWLESRSR